MSPNFLNPRTWFSGTCNPRSRKAIRPSRLAAESLEDRRVLATVTHMPLDMPQAPSQQTYEAVDVADPTGGLQVCFALDGVIKLDLPQQSELRNFNEGARPAPQYPGIPLVNNDGPVTNAQQGAQSGLIWVSHPDNDRIQYIKLDLEGPQAMDDQNQEGERVRKAKLGLSISNVEGDGVAERKANAGTSIVQSDQEGERVRKAKFGLSISNMEGDGVAERKANAGTSTVQPNSHGPRIHVAHLGHL